MITLPWDGTQAAYVAALLREQAQSKVNMAALLRPDSLVKDLQVDLADQAIMIDGMATDLLSAEVIEPEREDDLGDTRSEDPDQRGLDA